MSRWAETLVVFAVLALGNASAAAQPTQDEWHERTGATLRKLVEEFTGPVARSCGILWLDFDERPPVSAPDDAAVAAALACVLEARNQGRATWAFWQFRGIDSTVLSGLATAPKGDVQTLHYDDYGGRVDFDLMPCVHPRLQREPNLGIACDNRIDGLSAPALEQALTRLGADVAATTGDDLRGLVARVARETEAASSPTHPGFLTTVVGAVQLAIEEASSRHWPVCPRHGGHPLDFRDHRWFCARDGAFLADLGGLAAISRKPFQ